MLEEESGCAESEGCGCDEGGGWEEVMDVDVADGRR